jgi:hypothetical protein
MIRFLKRLWARLTHRHDWQVIHRASMVYTWRSFSGRRRKRRVPVILERCICGEERACSWDPSKNNRREDIDPQYYRQSIQQQGYEIPDDRTLRS